MTNSFLAKSDFDTAILLEKAIVTDIGKAVAYTNEKKELFLNTEDNLYKILPNYNEDMLKWLLWHEEYHCLLEHAKRYFKYQKEFTDYIVTQQEVNVIMDILVHDIMREKFPEIVDLAKENLAQFRERNSLQYTFKTHTLEEMIKEYAEYKKSQESEQEDKSDSKEDKEDKGEEDKDKSKGKSKKKEGGSGRPQKTKDKELKDDGDTTEEDESTSSGGDEESEQEEADWSGLEDRDETEFIDESKSMDIKDAVARLKRRTIKLGQLTQSLNGLASTIKQRTYRVPSHIQVQPGVILKGKMPGFAKLYFVFDASGSMSGELSIFKNIINNAIPQALTTPTEWFSGWARDEQEDLDSRCRNKERRECDYYKGQFKDMQNVYAASGYNDDGYRTLELCLKAEQAGYSPIGVTDGGGDYDTRTSNLARQLKKTTLVGHNKKWLDYIKSQNPSVQTFDVDLYHD